MTERLRALLAFLAGEEAGDGHDDRWEATFSRSSRRALRRLRGIIYRALVILFVYTLRFIPDGASVLYHASLALILAIATLSAGALIGFLFGLPRSPARPSTGATAAQLATNGREANGEPPARTGPILEPWSARNYMDNTNLEQVSDWLTKILIGIGLTQIVTLPGTLGSLSTSLAPAFGGSTEASLLVGSSIVLFMTLGFIYGYLWSRLSMGAALAEEQFASDRSTLEQRLAELTHDKKTKALVRQQLDPGRSEVAADDLSRALQGASEDVRVTLFRDAARARRREHQDARRYFAEGSELEAVRRLSDMARTIPVFEALLRCDWSEPSSRGHHHEIHAQLGYALKDKAKPTDVDIDDAISHLTTAMALCAEAEISPSALIPFNRAISWIRQGGERVGSILDDLTVALETDETLEDEDGDVGSWLEANANQADVKEWMATKSIIVSLIQGPTSAKRQRWRDRLPGRRHRQGSPRP